ncbi:hypothetical protein QN005_004451, partial [Escherichia coli]|nr:hypothetical protein [Escherichia coli]
PAPHQLGHHDGRGDDISAITAMADPTSQRSAQLLSEHYREADEDGVLAT